jgi:glycine betaine/proline transport system substrate-binding protein
VKFAGLNWESGMLLTEVMQFVLKNGYGCNTDSLPGNSISMENALSSNDIQVFAEEWVGRSEVWNKARRPAKSSASARRWWARSKAGMCRAT